MLNQIKDEIAQKHNFKNWKVLLMYFTNNSFGLTIEKFDKICDEVIERKIEYLKKEIKELKEKLSDSKA